MKKFYRHCWSPIQIPERLAYYNEKIYHDSLTGAYNRRFFRREDDICK